MQVVRPMSVRVTLEAGRTITLLRKDDNPHRQGDWWVVDIGDGVEALLEESAIF